MMQDTIEDESSDIKVSWSDFLDVVFKGAIPWVAGMYVIQTSSYMQFLMPSNSLVFLGITTAAGVYALIFGTSNLLSGLHKSITKILQHPKIRLWLWVKSQKPQQIYKEMKQ